MSDSVTPRPDPTLLTTEQLRRELGALRDLIETRLDAMDAANDGVASDLRAVIPMVGREIALLTSLVDARVDGINERFTASTLFRDQQVVAIGQRIADSQVLYKERFDAADLRYQQRYDASDKALTAASIAAQAGINAALAAAKEAVQSASVAAEKAVAAQNESNAAATLKSEVSFTKQIDGIMALLAANSKTLDEKIASINSRLDRGDGVTGGAHTTRTESRLDSSLMLGIGGLCVSVIVMAIALYTINNAHQQTAGTAGQLYPQPPQAYSTSPNPAPLK